MSFDISKFAAQMPSNRPRTIETVTQDVLQIKKRVGEDFMELGHCLCEAKEMLPHGEWLPWLSERVQFSDRTAQKYMALWREYEGNPQLASDLGSEKAFALLALPMEEREDIAANGAVIDGKTKPASNLTKKDVQQIVRERKEPYSAEREVSDYLQARAEEDAWFREKLHEAMPKFVRKLGFAQTRQDGIAVLKHTFSGSGGCCSGNVMWAGFGSGLEFWEPYQEHIKRSWTEVWDHLAVLVLQDAAKKNER